MAFLIRPVKAISRKVGHDEIKLNINWQPIETRVWNVQACELKLIFKRGRE
jgi:hypothetical protein